MTNDIKQRIEMINRGEVPEGYKKVKVGIVPSEWEIKRFIDVTKGKGVYGINAPSTEFNINLPLYLRITDIDINGKYIKENLACVDSVESKNYYLEIDDIVFARTGATVGKTYLYNPQDGILVYAGFLIKFTINTSKANGIIIKNYCCSKPYWDWVKTMSARSGQPGINAEEYAQIQLPLPPLPEQEKIAEILTTCDKVIELKEKLIAEKQAQKKWLMQNLLAGKKRLNGFTGEWKKVKLEKIITFINGQAHENEIDNDGKYIVVNSKFISTQGEVKKYSNSMLCPCLVGDILMVMSDVPNGKALCKCFLVDKNDRYTVNQRICILRTQIENNKYLFYLLNRNDYFLSFDNGVGQTNLRKSDITDMNVYLPPLNEQTAIANILSTADREIELMQADLSEWKNKKKSLMQLLLTGKVRVSV